ncbi:hypothetical protein ACRAWF_38160 [Streptomyces sp. L7]
MIACEEGCRVGGQLGVADDLVHSEAAVEEFPVESAEGFRGAVDLRGFDAQPGPCRVQSVAYVLAHGRGGAGDAQCLAVAVPVGSQCLHEVGVLGYRQIGAFGRGPACADDDANPGQVRQGAEYPFRDQQRQVCLVERVRH